MVRTYKVVSCFKMPKRGAKVVPAQSETGVFTIDMSSTSTLDIAVSCVSNFIDIALKLTYGCLSIGQRVGSRNVL